MDKGTKDQNFAAGIENFVHNWNGEFPEYTLKITDLKDTIKLISALFQVFNRLGIDCDAVVAPPPESERDEHTQYYWDLLPIINVTRVINHLVSVMPQLENSDKSCISIGYFLQPSKTTSQSILLLPFNLMIFNQSQLRNIAPYEEELFGKREQVKYLEDQKNKLKAMLNEQAKEKARRSERLLEIDHDIRQFEEELKSEKDAHDEEKQDLEAILKDNQQLEQTVEQKRAHRDAIMHEVARKQVLRVFDAADIRAQMEQSAQNVQEAEDKLSSLKVTLHLKENALKNLQNVKPNLDGANSLLHEIMKLSGTLKCIENFDNEPDIVEDDLERLQEELKNGQAQLLELSSAHTELNTNRAENLMKRQEHKAIAISALEEAEQRDLKKSEITKKAVIRIKEIKHLTSKFEEDKAKGTEELLHIKDSFHSKLRTFSDALLVKAAETEKDIEDKRWGIKPRTLQQVHRIIDYALDGLDPDQESVASGVLYARVASTPPTTLASLQLRPQSATGYVRWRMVRGAAWARGEARVADDKDFQTLNDLLSTKDGWTLEYEKDGILVWAENAAHGALRTVKVVAEFEDVSSDALYDVLHDPEYRSVWDTHMLAAEDAGHINVNNDVGYYAMSCPAPLKNRDFVLQRSWLDTGDEKMILNHSVYHKDFPPRKGYVRAISLLTGFVVRTRPEGGSWLGYVSRSDPRGALPAWLVNRVTAQLAPRLVHQLHSAARRYPGWKAITDRPYYKPWRHPEQVPSHRINLADCIDPDAPPIPEEPKPETSNSKLSKLEVPKSNVETHSVEDLGDISSEFSLEVEEDSLDQTLDPTKRKGKFYKLVKSMKSRRKSVQVAKSADNLAEGKSDDKPDKPKKGFKFHRRFSLNRGRED